MTLQPPLATESARPPRPGPGTFAWMFTAAELSAMEDYDWTAPDPDLERDFGMRE